MVEHVKVGALLMDSVSKQTIEMVLHSVCDCRGDPCVDQISDRTCSRYFDL